MSYSEPAEKSSPLKTGAKAVLASAAIFGFILVATPDKIDYDLAMERTVKVIPEENSHGSGVVVGERTIITAEHVVAGKDEVTVELMDGATMKARVVWHGAGKFDSALILTDKPLKVKPAKMRATPLKMGEPVFAVGNPGPAHWVLAAGIVASYQPYKPGESVAAVLDMAISPGFSGGPVFDARGELVGISVHLYMQPTMFALLPTGKAGMIPVDMLREAFNR